jgi:hypothetical protein
LISKSFSIWMRFGDMTSSNFFMLNFDGGI